MPQIAVLQKHYKVLEAMALDLDEVPHVDDQIQPYFVHEAFAKRVKDQLDHFRAVTLPDGYNPETKKPVKGRKLEAASGKNKEDVEAKKAKYDEMSLEELANNQLLKNLTIAQLRAKAAQTNIAVKSSAKKNDLIAFIEHFYGMRKEEAICEEAKPPTSRECFEQLVSVEAKSSVQEASKLDDGHQNDAKKENDIYPKQSKASEIAKQKGGEEMQKK
ncbi:unnamed protein product [Anisakis simplex]|uniref:ATP-dependent DNA helicase 2 subunit 1 (inferred by orthology to a D. melanogaster protein) n=1 Tax=Anisakis simplex TaxID=6269 RepID=A0A0M3K514_ANISI|nr:unnamed protein product [Anisakis simplex]